jgi:hypothetical protein
VGAAPNLHPPAEKRGRWGAARLEVIGALCRVLGGRAGGGEDLPD